MADRTSTYESDQLRIIYDRKLCIHVGECGRADNPLFDATEDPWCRPDMVDVETAVAVVERCPSGALRYERKDGGPEEQASPENEISVAQDGPLYAWGQIDLDGQDGQGVPFRVALCRCGASNNKPLCDGSHAQVAFKDSGAVGQTGEPLSERGGTLTINRAPNGPLLLSGNFQIRASSGRVAFSGTKAALCRCGRSKNKPFCDGAHAREGFQAD